MVPCYSERELDRRSPSLADAARTHMVMDADLSRFKPSLWSAPANSGLAVAAQGGRTFAVALGSLGRLTGRVTLWFKAPTAISTKILGLTSTLSLEAAP